MREYFWDFVQHNWEKFKKFDDVDLSYLLVRRLANSLSKEQLIKLIGDPKISLAKAHPMEFYIWPPINEEYEMGDILQIKGQTYILLTPSCDLVLRTSSGKRKADRILLAKCMNLKDTEKYKKFNSNRSNKPAKEDVTDLMKNKIPRYFFLPKSPFIEDVLIDFQDTLTVSYGDLTKYTKIAKLDDPFAQSVLASFIAYYCRVGTEDLDIDSLIKTLD